jgi:predicted transcriptional regulator
VLELAAEVDRPASTIQRALRRLHDEGRLVTHRVQRVAISGAVQRVPAYTILPRRP